MSAILLVARAEARRRRAALIGLALLIALVGTAVLGSAAGARRSASALERFQDETDTRDGRAFAFVLGADVAEDLVAEIGALDGVAAVGGAVIYGTDASFDIDTSILVPIDDVQFRRIDRPLLLDGRLPDPAAADEVVLSEMAVERLDLHTGDRLQTTTFSDEDCAALAADDFQGFNGPTLDLEVVGEVRVIEELQGSAVESGPVAIATPAFAAALSDDACGVGVFASARYEEGGGPTNQEMTAATRRAAPETGETGAGRIEDEFLDGVSSAIDVVIVGLGVFALVAGVAGLVALTQAVARQVDASGGFDEALGAVGLTASQRAIAAALPLILYAVPGAMLAMVGAAVLSPLFPLGVARRAEPDPGVLLDPLLLVGGAVALVVLVGVTAFLASRRQGHRVDARARDSRLGGLTARAGAAPPVVVGLQMVDAPGRGRRGVRTAAVGTALALAGVCAVMVVASSLSVTVDEPDRYGWAWSAKPDLDSDDPPATIELVARQDEVAAIAALDQASLEVEGEGIEGFALDIVKGSMAFPVLDGRTPASATEIALGAVALPDVDVGDTVTVRVTEDEDRELNVVGRVVLPPFDSAGAGTALVTAEVIGDLAVDEDRSLVLTYADDADVVALEARLEAPPIGLSFPAYARPNPPGRLVHLEDIRGLLVALAGFFALLGLAGLVHALAAATRYNRHQFATLRSLGFQRRQVVRSVAVFVLVIIGAAAVIGVPVGVVMGRLSWLAAVGDLGIVDTPSVPLGPAALAVLVAAAAGLVLAAGPAWREARRPPVEMLRVE